MKFCQPTTCHASPHHPLKPLPGTPGEPRFLGNPKQYRFWIYVLEEVFRTFVRSSVNRKFSQSSADNLRYFLANSKQAVVYPGSAKCGFWKGIDSEPPYQSARYLTLPKSVILQTPDIPPRVAQSLHHKTRVPPRSWAIYIGVQNYKSSKSSAPPQTREPDARRLFREVLPIGGMSPRV